VVVFDGSSPAEPSGSGRSSSLGLLDFELLRGVLGHDQADAGRDRGNGSRWVDRGGRITVEDGPQGPTNSDENGTYTGESCFRVFHLDLNKRYAP